VHLDFGTLILSETRANGHNLVNQRGVLAVGWAADSGDRKPGIISRVREEDLRLDRRVSVAPMMDYTDARNCS
jgi:hypothetical protein